MGWGEQSNLTRDRQLGEEIEEADDKEEEKDIDRERFNITR